ncbi:MAG: transglycosylase domain-containing protein [Bacteriovoracaceae bacterium]|nr:transglycosylase domain-containing protein [Bacteriovoracaceae bacterium]
MSTTLVELQNDELSLDVVNQANQKTIYLDNNGNPLVHSYMGQWNSMPIPLVEFPSFLIEALLFSEDKNFYSHGGIDWKAKIRATFNNLFRLGLYQGGSTISEQAVRTLIKKRKTVWNRWIQMWQATILEGKYTKDEILSFYINQVPFASHRRGFVEAAHLYFNRSIETLSKTEMLALATIVKSPSRLDIRKGNRIEKSINRLASRMKIKVPPLGKVTTSKGSVRKLVNPLPFIDLVKGNKIDNLKFLKTTMNIKIQSLSEAILKSTLEKLKTKGASHGALMVVDHQKGDVLAVVSHNGSKNGYGYNTTLIPRQPGSTLKPFLYTLAFEKGSNPGDLIDDSPLESNISGGLHQITNYSRNYYGKLTLREALGNSLNIPAVKLVREVGEENFFEKLVDSGISLSKDVNFYGEGLALGNMEVSLTDMVSSWTCVVNRGVCKDLRFYEDQLVEQDKRVFQRFAADMTLDILSDSNAREKEFGSTSFSHQVGFKTGTSTDYRDSWAFVFNSKYLIGVWIGNLDGSPMDEVTGAKGALRVGSTLIEKKLLNEFTGKFKLDPILVRRSICVPRENGCEEKEELAKVGDLPKPIGKTVSNKWKITPMSDVLHLAVDPRIPRDLQIIKFRAEGEGALSTTWFLNDAKLETTDELAFKLRKGKFELKAINELTGKNKNIEIFIH